MNFIRVIDFEDGVIQVFHYEVVPSASTQNQERSRMNTDMPIGNLSSNHTPEDRSHENSIFKSLSNSSDSQSNNILDGNEGIPERSQEGIK